MTISTRLRWLCAALPAALTLLIYLGAFARPVRRGADALRAECRRLEMPGAREARLARALAERERLTREQGALIGNEPAGAAALANGTNRMAVCRASSLRELSRLCKQAGVTLVCAMPLPGHSPFPAAPAAAETLLLKAGWGGAETWQLALRGTYPAMVSLIESMAAAGFLVMPAGVGMETMADEAHANGWTLTVWI